MLPSTVFRFVLGYLYLPAPANFALHDIKVHQSPVSRNTDGKIGGHTVLRSGEGNASALLSQAKHDWIIRVGREQSIGGVSILKGYSALA